MRTIDQSRYRHALEAFAPQRSVPIFRRSPNRRMVRATAPMPVNRPNAPLHLGDSGTEEFLFELNMTLLENE